TGAITRVSTDASGTQANGDSYDPSLSADGQFVAFYSLASNLVAGDTNGTYDIFVKDLTNGAITRVSTDAFGAQANNGSYFPFLSADGQFVAFYSDASSLITGDTNGVADIFVKELTSLVPPSTTTSVTVDGSGNLVIEDVLGADSDDTLTVVIDPVGTGSGAEYVITDAANGISQRILVSAVTGSIIVDTLGGDDTLTIDLGGGAITRNIVFNGGTGGDDDLVILDSSDATFLAVTYSFANANDGSIQIAGQGLITYTGLEPITSTITATDVVLTFNGGAETITVSDGTPGDGFMTVDSTLGESLSFAVPTGSLTINAGSGNDIINVTSVDAAFGASLILNGDAGNDTVNLNGDITFAADKHLDVDLQNDATAGDADQVNFGTNANLILSGTGTATISASRNITFASGSSLETVNGNLTVEANQQATATAQDFDGVEVLGVVRVTGLGALSVAGKGGTSSFNYGVRVQTAGGLIEGGIAGSTVTVTGAGGMGAFVGNFGVGVADSGEITSIGGAVSVEGQGRGNGSGYGVSLSNGGKITAGGAGAVTVTGTGGGGSSSENFGVFLNGAGSAISSAGGSVLVEGTGGGAGTGASNHGVFVHSSGTITSAGTGAGATVTVRGTG
ncbi:MAG: PD40 domain-containing protein, partial [Verrucomicrobiae bacterium]|nr:PD40 domain-containing protein [Verrucomicrobiae bacterium]